MAIKSRRICENCGVEIGPYETPYLHDWKVVCAVCDLKLKSKTLTVANFKSVLGISAGYLLLLVLGIGVGVLGGYGLYQWGHRDGRAEGVAAARALAAAPTPLAHPATTHSANEFSLPDDPDAVLALMRYGLLRKGMSMSAWKSSAEVNRIRTTRRSGEAAEPDAWILEEVVAGSTLPTLRYKAVVKDDRIVSWENLNR